MQPGQTIGPSGPETNNDQQAAAPEASPQATQNNTPAASEPMVDAGQPAPQTQSSDSTDKEVLSWSASEFIESQKPAGWYVTVVVLGVVLSVVVYLALKDVVSAVVVAFAALMFAVVGSHKPSSKQYAITNDAVLVGDKKFPFDDFRHFSLLEEGVVDLVQLFPLKKFTPPVSMYFPPQIADQVLAALADHLPHEEKDHEMVDKLMKRLKF